MPWDSLVDANLTATVVIRFRPSPELITTQHIPPPAHRRGSGRPWRMDTHLRRYKASELETFRPVENAIFTYPHLHLAPSLEVIPSEYRRDLLDPKTRVPWACLRDARCSRF